MDGSDLHEPDVLRFGVVEQVRVAQQHQPVFAPLGRRLSCRVTLRASAPLFSLRTTPRRHTCIDESTHQPQEEDLRRRGELLLEHRAQRGIPSLHGL